MLPFRVGQGYDVHKLVEGRRLLLCGIHVPYEYGLLGHSDADVAIHALCDALLGAAGMRDIGYHFPDTDKEHEGKDSRIFLREVCRMIDEAGWQPGNVDVTIVAQKPKLSPYIPAMIESLAETMLIPAECINVKATTTERLGFEGRMEGISANAIALINRKISSEQ